jgi:hypothetical protein
MGRTMTELGKGKIAGVAIDDWKLEIFKKHLDAAGYKYEEPVQFTPGTLILKVRYKWAHELQPIIEAAQRECAQNRPKEI